MRHAEALVNETVEVLEQTSKHMRKLARLLRRSRVQCLRGEYDALYAFAEQASKTMEVGQDVGTKINTLMMTIVPKEYLP